MTRRIKPTRPPATPEVRTIQDVGAWVRAQRTRLGLRIDDAAALCGVSVPLFSALEGGTRPVRLDNVLQVIGKLGLAMAVVPQEQVGSILDTLDRDKAAPLE